MREMLRRITTLFLHGSDSFNDDHVRLFDDVFGCLINEIESRARRNCRNRLAPVANAPLAVVRRLAKDEDIMVAGPVLAQSPRLDDTDLVEIASTKRRRIFLRFRAALRSKPVSPTFWSGAATSR